MKFGKLCKAPNLDVVTSSQGGAMAVGAARVDPFARVRADQRLAMFRSARASENLPYFRELQSRPGPVAIIGGRERVVLGCNGYLGLDADGRVLAAAQDALKTYGTALSGSRLNATIPLHRQLEQELAAWTDSEDAIVFTTGYQANLGCLSALLNQGDSVVIDSACHASIIDGCSLSGAQIRPFGHGDQSRLARALSFTGDGAVIVVAEGVYSMHGDICDIVEVSQLARRQNARLVLDDAHGIGVLGRSGAGTAELLDARTGVDLITGTLSKALASCGGFIAGPADVVDYMRIAARPFLFAASSVPAAIGAALAAVRICRSGEGPDLFRRLLDNASYLRAGLSEVGFEIDQPSAPGVGDVDTPIVPVLVGDERHAIDLWNFLWERGIYTNLAVFPAVTRRGALVRAIVKATHTRQHLDRAIQAFGAARRSNPGFWDLA